VDALQLRNPRRARAVRCADRRGPPFERRPKGGVAPRVSHLGPRSAPRHRQGDRRLQGGARVPGEPGMNERVDRLRALLEEPLLVTTGVNVRYLVGFQSSNAALLVDEKRVLLFTDFRYADAARKVEVVEFVQTERSLLKTVAEQ